MAKCPLCENTDLQATHFENILPVMECRSCGGSWLRANEYTLWLKSQKPGTFDESKAVEASERLPVVESNKAAICPDCGHFLRKYRVGSKLVFQLDRCNNCNGVWLDRNEWESLKLADLHDEINQIFTQPWQKRIQDEIAAGKLDMMYMKKFGEDDYKKVKEIRKWIWENANRSPLLAFLLDKDPYLD
ncbi:MAG: zf-TFIIB domain-containing protein [Anaerolineae bacterium]|nr:zf-TFIIB domain-containing protein [Anaerolineae bacterium]